MGLIFKQGHPFLDEKSLQQTRDTASLRLIGKHLEEYKKLEAEAHQELLSYEMKMYERFPS